MSLVLVILAIETLIALGWVSFHFGGPFEIRLILYLFKDSVHKLLEHRVDYLGIGSQGLANEIFPWLIMAVPIRPRIFPFGKEDLGLSFALHLILFDPFLLINTVHQLAHTPSRLHG